MKRILAVLLAFGILLGLNACRAEKLDKVPLQTESGTPAAEEAGTKERYDEQFVTDNGLIQISIQDNSADPIPETMPILRVRPKVITIPMVRQIAGVAFGDAPLYEYTNEISKAEVAEMIAVWEEGVTDEAIRSAYGEDFPDDLMENVRQGRLDILEYYRNAYAYAKEEVTPVSCQWQFWPSEHYFSYDYAGTDSSYTDDIPYGLAVELNATAEVNGIPYRLSVNNNETDQFRNHSLSIFVNEPEGLGGRGSAAWLEWYKSMALFSDRPATEQELEGAALKATQMLKDMGLGGWQVTAEAREDYEGEWTIWLEALPVYEGYPVSRQELGDWLSAPAGQNYYYGRMGLQLKNDGTLLRMEYWAPLEVVEVVEQAAPLLGREQIRAAASDAMHAWSYGDLFGYTPEIENSWWGLASISECRADMDSVRVGYARVKYDETDFLLVPSVTFQGRLQVTGALEGVTTEAIDLIGDGNGSYCSMLVLDLTDGSVILLKHLAEN